MQSTSSTTASNGHSLAEVFAIRSKAFTEIREHTTAIERLAAALGDVDVAMQMSIDCRNIDSQQNLITSARRLAALLDMRGSK